MKTRWKQWAAGSLLTLLVFAGEGGWRFQSAIARGVLASAKVVETSSEGQLDERDEQLRDGSYYEDYTLEGTAGEGVLIELLSDDFDAYLTLIGPNGKIIASDDDSAGGSNSRMLLQLPLTGTYRVRVNTYDAREQGAYRISWRPANAEELAEIEVWQRIQQAIARAEEGRYAEAETLWQEALAMAREKLGDRHLGTAAVLDILGDFYLYGGRYSEAEPLLQEAISISREQLGDRHPTTARRLNQLGFLYDEVGRYREAELLLQEAISISREQLGDRHPLTAVALDNLATVYRKQGRYSEAEPLVEEAVATFREQLGDRHPDTGIGIHNLALLYHMQGRLDEAEPLYLEAIAIFRATDQQSSLAKGLYSLSMLYRNQGRQEAADSLYQEAMEIMNRL